MVTVLQLLIIHEMLENSNCQVTLCFSLTKCTCLLMYYKLIGCMLLSLAEPILSATKQSVNSTDVRTDGTIKRKIQSKINNLIIYIY